MSTAVITGASRGIGRAAALALARDGYAVAVGYHRDAKAAAAVEEIHRDGGQAAAFALDVGNQDQCAEFVRTAGERLGPVRAVISNATGFSATSPALGEALDTPWRTYEQMFTTRVGSLLALVAAACPQLTGGGRVVTTVSTGTSRHVPGSAAIAAAMASAESVVRYLAVELGRDGITADLVSGGVVATDALRDISSDPERLLSAAARATPLGRPGTPEDLVDVISFLCSKKAAWITGRSLTTDGGHSLR
ncbi:SDR family oxidoreductase [Actinomadura sp. KC345]|uniref:SDR family oxidoreductase n=1 Tax=Actinomadura sp. KC345 TaxID=2530371 RepID=UPI00104DC667|nr:SDR family oxidoreductase [Actinomadura sp. KC345]TDC56437.1 SDR family oxidoreductase [Actinomadura sp. KC345]